MPYWSGRRTACPSTEQTSWRWMLIVRFEIGCSSRRPSQRSTCAVVIVAIGWPPNSAITRPPALLRPRLRGFALGARRVVAVALERRGLDAVDVLDMVKPVGGDLVERDRARRRLGRELLLVGVDE